jgi:tryptophanyl-tRNA synthetase
MTQFKDKSSQISGGGDDFVSAGLFDYPVLQTADILIYKADYVPVGKDQEQHLELARDIAQRFNSQTGKEYFVLPEGLYTEAPKIRSTADPLRKMSKSAGEKHAISVFSEEAVLRKRIKSAVTDTGDTPEGQMSEGVDNLFLLLKMSGGLDAYNSLMDDYNSGALKYVDLKEATADALVNMTSIFIERKKELNSNKKEIKDQIKQSASEIRKVAQQTLAEVKDLTGLLNVRF